MLLLHGIQHRFLPLTSQLRWPTSKCKMCHRPASLVCNGECIQDICAWPMNMVSRYSFFLAGLLVRMHRVCPSRSIPPGMIVCFRCACMLISDAHGHLCQSNGSDKISLRTLHKQMSCELINTCAIYIVSYAINIF